MKNFFIFLSVIIIGALAYVDAKDRLEELSRLDKVSDYTPSQIEMKQTIPPTYGPVQRNIPNINPNTIPREKPLHEQIKENSNHLQQKYDVMNKQRESISNPFKK